MKKCPQCKTAITDDPSGKKIYCKESCRSMAYRLRQKVKNTNKRDATLILLNGVRKKFIRRTENVIKQTSLNRQKSKRAY